MLVGSIQATTELTSHRVGAATIHVELIWASLVKQAKKEKKLKFLCSTKSEKCTKKNLKDHVKQSGNTSLLRVEGKKPKLSNTTYFHTNRNITAKNKWEKRLRTNCKSREHWNNVIVLIIKTKIEVLLSKIGNDYVAGENLTCVHLLLSILWSSDDCTDTTINAVCKTTDFLISEL